MVAAAAELHDPAPLLRPELAAGPGRVPRFPFAQRSLEVRGVPTAFFDHGQGPVIVLVHGLAANLTYWVHVAPALAVHHRIIGLDLPGHGATGRLPGRLSLPDASDHVLALADALGLDRFTIVGHSLGGMVGADLAIRRPERLDAAVLINPAGLRALPLALRLGGHSVLRVPLLERALPRYWKGLLGRVCYRDNHYTRRFVEAIEASSADPAASVRPLARAIAELRHDFLDGNLLPLLERTRVPLTFLWGTEDRLVPARSLRRAAARIPGAKTVEIASCGHMPPIEAPDLVVLEVGRAIARAMALAPDRKKA